MLSVRLHKTNKAGPSRWKLLIWTAVASLVFGLLGMGELPEDMLRISRNGLHTHRASGDIVLVAIDDQSLRDIGRWPWKRQQHAKMVNELTGAGANRIFLDIIINARGEPGEDAILAKAIRQSGKVTVPINPRSGQVGVTNPDFLPSPVFGNQANLAAINFTYNYQNSVWRLDYEKEIAGRPIPTFAAKLANVKGRPNDTFMLYY